MISLLLAAVAFEAGWQLTSNLDPITDQGKATAELRTDKGALRIECDGEEPSKWMLTWETGVYLGDGNSDRLRPAIYRLDAKPPVQTRWTYIDNWAAIREGRDQLARDMRSSSRAVFRGTSHRGETVTIEFDVTGFAAALDNTLTQCGASAR